LGFGLVATRPYSIDDAKGLFLAKLQKALYRGIDKTSVLLKDIFYSFFSV
jgi:hypothetical protein